jgi:hypothetical protein
MDLALIMTARCNASCAHCAAGYGPHRTEALTRDAVLRLMSEAAAVPGKRRPFFAITGGEPFLDFGFLVEVVRHASGLGAQVGCVTNAYWARTDEISHARLSTLVDAGLQVLAVSVSRFHQQFVPMQRARRALRVAQQLGLHTELKGAVVNSDLGEGGSLSQWQGSLSAKRILVFPVLPHLREGESLAEHEYYRERGLPDYKCPAEIVSVDFHGTARSCCSPGVPDEFLALGDVTTQSMAEIDVRFRLNAKQRILREIGPIHFAHHAIAQGLGHRLRDAYAGPCDLCLHIRTDDELRRAAEEAAALWEMEDSNNDHV